MQSQVMDFKLFKSSFTLKDSKRLKKNEKCISMGNATSKLVLTSTQHFLASAGIFRQEIKKIMREDPFGKEHNLTMKHVEENIIGNDLLYEGPFGKRTVVYCDYTASGKAIRFIENYIRDEVLPYYGNTHTTTNVSSRQTSMLRAESKQIIRSAMNASGKDAVIFVSSGTTGAIVKLIHALNLKESPIVFISPFEHHSNLLPWLEVGAEVIYGEENATGTMDLELLEENLKKHSTSGRPLIGSFSAASNITGIMNDTEALSILMHKYGGYAFFDYATAGPYLFMDMNPNLSDPKKDELNYKDAIFCSIHKFVGGPGTPGLLVAKKSVFKNSVPTVAGGGTVLFVTHKKHHYVDDIEEKEEGGTPAIVESIRAGLVFQLKEEVTTKRILDQDHFFMKRAFIEWGPIHNIHILGPSTAERLPIFSLVIEYEDTKRMLHHNFVSSLLNDLFGIQARGGCACAGPYAEDLLGIDSETAEGIAKILLCSYSSWEHVLSDEDLKKIAGKKFGILKPGFARLNLPYFMSKDTIDFILQAIIFIAKHGWKFLPMYEMNPETGDFTHEGSKALVDVRRLKDVRPLLRPRHEEHKYKPSDPLPFKDVMAFAENQVMKIEKSAKKGAPMPNSQFLPKAMDNKMRWFLLPSEAHAILQGNDPYASENHYQPMFYPRSDSQKCLSNRLQRSRLKSGLSSVKFCTCLREKKRHLRKKHCLTNE